MTRPADPLVFKRGQREQWSKAAHGWRRWWRTFESGAQVLNDDLVRRARIGGSQRVLDVACGLGEPTLTAARAAPDASIVGFDLAPDMVRLARERACELGLSNATFVEADGETLGFRAQSFDAAISRWGYMLMPDPVRGLSETRRVLRPGALLAAAVWSTADEVPFIATTQVVGARALGAPLPDENTPGPMRLGRRGALEERMQAAGFEVLESADVVVVMTFGDVAEYLRFQRELGTSFDRLLEGRDASVVAATWAAVEEEASKYALADGRLRFENVVHVALARA